MALAVRGLKEPVGRVGLRAHQTEAAQPEFQILARIINRPDLADDGRFKTMSARKAHEKDLDAAITAWTQKRDRDWMVQTFVNAGLIAAPSREGRDIYADPHMRARGSFMKVRNPELGELELIGPPWKFSGFEIPQNPAPLLGEHNAYVLGKLLGLSESEIDGLREKEIIS